MGGRPKNLSPKRREWLQTLVKGGPLKCKYTGSVGVGCRIFGWTEWAYSDPAGNIMPISEAFIAANASTLQELWDLGYRPDPGRREYITTEGRAMMESCLTTPEAGGRVDGFSNTAIRRLH